MKKKLILPILLIAGSLSLNFCGDKGTSDNENAEKTEVRVLNASLDSLITSLAACEEQNTNCEAYSKASDGITAMCKDDSKRDAIIDDLIYIIQTGPSARTQAAASAVEFWVGTSKFSKNAQYGHVVLDALKKEKFEQNNYTGSELGQLLSNWWDSDDKELVADLISTISDKAVEKRGRSELIRLCTSTSLNDAKVFDAIVAMINDSTEEEALRIQGLNVLYRVQDDVQKSTARALYEGLLYNPSIKIAGASLMNLGYMYSTQSYPLISQVITNHKNDQDWYSYGSSCLTYLVQSPPDETLDLNAVFALTKELLSNKEITAWYRSYYVTTLSHIKTKKAEALLKQLKSSKEKEIADEATTLSKG